MQKGREQRSWLLRQSACTIISDMPRAVPYKKLCKIVEFANFPFLYLEDRPMNRPRFGLFASVVFTLILGQTTVSRVAVAQEESATATRVKARKTQRLLLLGQKPDGHPHSTHEYSAAMRILAKTLQSQKNLQTILVSADEPWKAGPELIDGADGVVIFVSEGGQWVHQDPARLAALNKLAARGGGFVGLHWGIGTRKAENIDGYLKLLGGCHGGPDRKYKVVDVRTEIANAKHPILNGVQAIDVHEEFYYTLKFVKPAGSITPLLQAPIDGKSHTVAWAWDRPNGGRSFGFSGLHFHENWRHVEYRRMVTQAILWTLKRPIPEAGLAVKVTDKDLSLPPPKTTQTK